MFIAGSEVKQELPEPRGIPSRVLLANTQTEAVSKVGLVSFLYRNVHGGSFEPNIQIGGGSSYCMGLEVTRRQLVSQVLGNPTEAAYNKY